MDHASHDAAPNMTFHFRAHMPPAILTFTPDTAASTAIPASASSYPRKRARPLADIDGYGYEVRDYTKKRRLRLKLITSRLSEPFAVPPTNILDRGNCPRVALWAKTRCVARGVLRKAAILNKIKRDAIAAREEKERQMEIARRQFRERLAAAAHASFQRSDGTMRFHRPVNHSRFSSRSPSPPSDASSPPLSPTSSSSSSGGGDDGDSRGNDTQGVDANFLAARMKRLIEPSSDRQYDDLSSYRRPPSPPSEWELDCQRRGMGLDIGVC